MTLFSYQPTERSSNTVMRYVICRERKKINKLRGSAPYPGNKKIRNSYTPIPSSPRKGAVVCPGAPSNDLEDACIYTIYIHAAYCICMSRNGELSPLFNSKNPLPMIK
jgi:hypothetical protein